MRGMSLWLVHIAYIGQDRYDHLFIASFVLNASALPEKNHVSETSAVYGPCILGSRLCWMPNGAFQYLDPRLVIPPAALRFFL